MKHSLGGLKAAHAESIDAILLDFNLSDIDGSQVGLVMRPTFKHTPIIALTAQTDRANRNKSQLLRL